MGSRLRSIAETLASPVDFASPVESVRSVELLSVVERSRDHTFTTH